MGQRPPVHVRGPPPPPQSIRQMLVLYRKLEDGCLLMGASGQLIENVLQRDTYHLFLSRGLDCTKIEIASKVKLR